MLSHFKPEFHWRWLVRATAHCHAEARRAKRCDRQGIGTFGPATVSDEGGVVSVDQGLLGVTPKPKKHPENLDLLD